MKKMRKTKERRQILKNWIHKIMISSLLMKKLTVLETKLMNRRIMIIKKSRKVIRFNINK